MFDTILKYMASLALCLLVAGEADAQFIHYTHNNMTPVMYNPANAGGFYGTFRVAGVVRDQDWATASSGNEYQMFNGSMDVNIDGIALKKEDWLSFGVNFGQQGVTADYKRTEVYPSIAYHYVLDKKTMSDLAVGFSVGSVVNSLKRGDDLVTRQGLLSGNTEDGMQIFNQAQDGKLNANSTDYSLGLVLTTPMSKTADVKMGIAVKQPFRPRVGLVSEFYDRLDREFTGFFNLYTDITDRLVFKPSILFNVEGKASKYLNVQANTSYLLAEGKDLWLNAGLGLRMLTDIKSLEFLVGADIKDTRIGVAFDLHFGGAAALSGGAGAVELSLSRVFKIHKKPEPQPILLCPRL